MKHLQDYIEKKQTALFNKTGSFFAFSQNQFNEAKKPEVKYTAIGSGLLCPTANVKELMDGLDQIHEVGIKQDIEENGIDGIIKRELLNHECYYTGDITDCIDKLEDYPITIEKIQEIFNQNIN